ncbi:hypothetical protein MCEMSEM23_01009 [Rhabdaerophilaceae bacterium]
MATTYALAQTSFPGRMPGDLPYAHEYGANAPFMPPVMPAPPLPQNMTTRLPEQSPGYQPVGPLPRLDTRAGRDRISPGNNAAITAPSGGKLIDVPGPRILER